MPPINPPGALPLLVIPGVDPSAPSNSQIDQIDQQITFMLQDIDANFARIHHVITERIIPALKRFDKDTQPVKEASKFWRSFFEAAAQIQVASTDQSLVSGAAGQTYEEQGEETISGQEGTATVETGSFLGPAVSSTPLPGTALSAHHISASDVSRGPSTKGGRVPRSPEEESWAASVESPFTKLDRQLRDDLKQDGDESESANAQSADMLSGFSSMLSTDTETPEHSPLHANYPPPSSSIASSSIATVQPLTDPTVKPAVATFQPVGEKDKGKQRADRAPFADRTNGPLLKNVLKANAARTPRAALNPFQPSAAPGTDQRKKWNGIADLRLPSPVKAGRPAPGAAHRTPKRGGVPTLNLPVPDDDDSDDDLPPGMSPPVTMTFTLPAKKLARTPAKEVARLAVEGMMRGVRGDTPSPEMEMERNTYGWQDTSLAHPTPPRRRPTASPAKPRASLAAAALHPGAGAGAGAQPGSSHPRESLLHDANGTFDSEDSSFDDFGSPPTQHLNYGGSAQQQQPGASASAGQAAFGSEEEEEDDDEGDSFSSVGSAPPGAQVVLGGRDVSVDDPLSDSDDSFEQAQERRSRRSVLQSQVAGLGRAEQADREEETVFGVGLGAGAVLPPAKAALGNGMGKARSRQTMDFELLGRGQEDMTVHGGRVEDAPVGESPTPWPRER